MSSYDRLVQVIRTKNSEELEMLLRDTSVVRDATGDASDARALSSHFQEDFTLLHVAAMSGNAEAIGLLLQHGFSIDAKTAKNQWTPLHFSVNCQFECVTEELVKHSADVNAQDSNGNTPLHLAAANGDEITLRILLSCNPCVNMADNKGNTPLHAAIGSDLFCEDVIAALLDHGADLGIVNNNGESPLQRLNAEHISAFAQNLRKLTCRIQLTRKKRRN